MADGGHRSGMPPPTPASWMQRVGAAIMASGRTPRGVSEAKLDTMAETSGKARRFLAKGEEEASWTVLTVGVSAVRAENDTPRRLRHVPEDDRSRSGI
eukprot:CAMPEP_0195086028 /NCGR_PEP_ID=MMETSP0448-20130528/26278_1 /TAXON_ID=66468 /ORGANISM="Heterocapsa triquestra, Strain CCMP 448" /LENGTH=97 /DNA_ID=CAMNT_0040119455 /DNA_START=15 /DNA_END=305 /DNA_ORIENTATION=-